MICIAPCTRALALLGFALALAPAHLCAEEVRIEHVGIELLGNLQKPGAEPLGAAGVVLIVHGTLGHHGMEVIAGVQKGLEAQGIASLAMTLSLGFNARRGMFDCALEHDHRQSDAGDEITAWAGWLKAQGAGRITVLGHSRGARQVVDQAVAGFDPVVDRLVLLAPLTDTAAEAAESYKRTHGGDLPTLLDAARKRVDGGADDSTLAVPGFLHCKAARVTAAAFLDYYDGDAVALVLGRLKDLKLPVLVVAAGADTIAPKVGERAKANQAGNVELAVIDGADHFFRDLFMDELIDRLKPFLVKAQAR